MLTNVTKLYKKCWQSLNRFVLVLHHVDKLLSQELGNAVEVIQGRMQPRIKNPLNIVIARAINSLSSWRRFNKLLMQVVFREHDSETSDTWSFLWNRASNLGKPHRSLEANLIVTDFYNFCVFSSCISLSLLVSFSFNLFHYLFLGLPTWQKNRESFMNCRTYKIVKSVTRGLYTKSKFKKLLVGQSLSFVETCSFKKLIFFHPAVFWIWSLNVIPR